MQPQSNHLLVVVGATIISWILRVSLAGLACLSNPCLNGICIDDINSTFTCFCADGFTGELCGTNWDECWSSPCENGGTCTDSIAAFNCSCLPGFTGERCEWNVDECASNPCLNGGSCIDQENGFSCSCPAGYGGNFCSIDISVCNLSYPMPHIPGPRCFNGGICLDGPGPSFTCICIAGWTGPRCEVQIDECATSPCKNGGLCIDLLADYSCACSFGYTGKNCEMTLQMCRGINGSRINIFGGIETDSLEEGNEEDVCENGALCLLESDGARVCYCVPDFHGDRCQYRYDECLLAESSPWLPVNGSRAVSSGHCQNGGECIDGVDSFTCSCPSNFTGHFCECPLYDTPDGEVDPYCLDTSTHPSKFPALPSEFTALVTSPSKTPPITPTTSYSVVETEKTAVETTTLETVSVTTDTGKPETFTVTQVVKELSTQFQETLSSTTVTDSEETKSSSPLTTGTTDFTTITSDSSSPLFFTTITTSTLSTVVPKKDETMTTTDTALSTSEPWTYFPEFSSPRVPSIDVEDKVWVSEKMTTLPSDATMTTPTGETTEFSSRATSTAVADVTLMSSPLGLPSSTSVPLETEKTTEGGSTLITYFPQVPPSESTKTEHPYYTSIDLTSMPFDDKSTHSTIAITDPTTFHTKPYTSVLSEDTASPTTMSPASESTDSLVTPLYTSEKVTVTAQEPTSGGTLPVDSEPTEHPMESTHFPVSESIAQNVTAGETTFTPVEPWGVTHKVPTDSIPYPGGTAIDTTSGTISYSEELPTEAITKSTAWPQTVPEVPTYGTAGIPRTSTEIEYVTTLETRPFTVTISDITKAMTETELPEVEHTSKVGIVTESTTEGPLIGTVNITVLTSPATGESSTTTFPEISTYISTEEPLDRTIVTDITSTTDTTPGSETPTDIGCNVVPCLNGGTCYYNECECTFRFGGRFCEKKKTVEVASFNGNSFLMHSLNISEEFSEEESDDDLILEDSKSNFKRHTVKNISSTNPVVMNKSSDEVALSGEQHEVFEEVYDYYEEYEYSHNYSYYLEEESAAQNESEEIMEAGKLPPALTEFKEHLVSNLSSKNETFNGNFTKHFHNLSSPTKDYSTTFPLGDSSTQNSMLAENLTTASHSPKGAVEITEPMKFNGSANISENGIHFSDPSPLNNNGRRHRGGRSLPSHSSLYTSIAVKINLQERSLRVGGWGLVMKISLGQMAKASLAINHKSGLMRFHFTCGLGRSLLFGEEDGQRWVGQGRRQPIQSIIIPVHVVLEVLPYEAVHKNNPSSGRSYLQCVASLKINGQVAVRGQQRAPMPKKPSGGVAKQNLLFLGGVPNMLLPCNQAIDESSSDEKEKPSKYEQIPENDDDEHEGFVGCMQDLKINGIRKKIFEDALDGNGITECGDTVLTGKDLDREDNPCFSLPCYGSSTCEVTEDGGWRCRCPTGWLGPSCEQSACDNNPCLYGATCLHDDVGGFACLCPLGKGGRLCENDIEVKKPCFDSANDWDVEEHQPYMAYPLDHNQLSSPQLVFRFKFSPASLNQIGLLAYIGDLKIPKSFQLYQSSFLSEIKESYFEATTNAATTEPSHLTEYPSTVPKDVTTESTSEVPSTVSPLGDITSLPTSLLEQNVLAVAEPPDATTDNTFSDFSPPLDIPLFQDDGPPYLQNFTAFESFNSYSNYIFSPFSPYPYYLRQNGKDHMAVSYIRGHLVLTWDLGSGPRRIFTVEPLPMLHDDGSSIEQVDSMPVFSIDLNRYPNMMPDRGLPESINQSTNAADPHVPHIVESYDEISPSILDLPHLTNFEEKPKEKSSNLTSHKDVQSEKYHTGSDFTPPRDTMQDSKLPSAQHTVSSSNNTHHYIDASEIGQNSFLNSDEDKNKPHTQNEDPTMGHSQAIAENINLHSLSQKEDTMGSQRQKSVMAQIVSPPSPTHFHEVTIWREGQQAWLKVGEQVVRGRSPGRHYQLNAHRPFLYLGGHDASNVSSLPHDIPLHSSFSGCIFDAELRFGGRHLVLNKRPSMFTRGRGVGECGLDSCQIAKSEKADGGSPCLNGGTCIPRGPTFICICQKPWFGPLCADSGHSPCDEGTHSCRSGSTCVVLPLGGYKCDCLPGTHGIYCEKDSPIGWGVKLTGHRSFLGVRVPFRGWKKRPTGGSSPDKPKREAFCIDLEIKPSKPNSGGLILFVMGSHPDEYLSLSISKKGDPELRIGPGTSRMSGPLVIGYNHEFQLDNFHQEADRPRVRARKNDGRSRLSGWRKIRIFRRGQRVFLAMDGLLHGAGTLDSPSQNLPTIRPYNNSIGSSLPLLYLGGLPDVAILPQDAVGDVRLARSFVGCIRSVAVDWQRVPLGEGAGSYGRNAYAC